MAFHPADSPLYRDLFGDADLAALFTDAAEVRAILLVEAALAKAQAAHGIIPQDAAGAIERAAREGTVDPASLAAETAMAGVPIPAILKAFRHEIGDPTLAGFLHFGATSQDMIDTGLMLRLRQALTILETRLSAILTRLRALALAEADTVMAARTRGQIATVTTFGARVAGWADPLYRHHAQLAPLRQGAMCLSLSGASGTRAAFGPKAHQIAQHMADALRLTLPDQPWHTSRDRIADIGHWLASVTGALGRIGQDVLILTRNEIGEVRITGGGGSSAMPHKANPVAAEMLIALARANADAIGSLHHAQLHGEERDGAAWAQEWLGLPRMVVQTGAALRHAEALLTGLEVNRAAMARTLDATQGLVFAEAAKCALAQKMPMAEAASLVSAACATVRDSGQTLRVVLEQMVDGDLDWDTLFDPHAQAGDAPRRARALPPLPGDSP
ncbi:3-carboxy-cis,cis-muconate cycloisomerase [Rubricella aquisinus]|uniref:3-carboxy-cis,cis-muconate cycloisomerase n=1 Tax=Rubricella aquisinus TaxID=2028108 RepID=A0A840WQX4_9RHOB|nr:adenylosuccinate lyase family protein [Rubricella aquisinus]MBB5516443.1 3-carboxy-cis,cis-muconate cycloisomerase [Rubricella aquisinus]